MAVVGKIEGEFRLGWGLVNGQHFVLLAGKLPVGIKRQCVEKY